MPPTRTTRLKPDYCPACFHRLDSATGAFEDVAPQAGDFTVCIQCGTILEFSETLQLKRLSKHAKQRIAETPKLATELARVVEGVQLLKRRN
jgi:hypothetical protein